MPMSSAYDLRQGTPGGGPRDSYFDQQPAGNAYNSGRQRYSRMASEPQFRAPAGSNGEGPSNSSNVYPLPGQGRSYETVTSGSSGAEGAGYQTDPTSSDNSSIERVQSPPKPVPAPNDYGIGFSQSPTYQPPAFTVGVNQQLQQPQQQRPPVPPQHSSQYGSYNNGGAMGAPPVPRKDMNGGMMRKPSAGPPVSMHNGAAAQRPGVGEKRKSWLARRFSKN
jgi:hypothetical protein